MVATFLTLLPRLSDPEPTQPTRRRLRSGEDENPSLAPAPAVALSLGEPSGDQITETPVGLTPAHAPSSDTCPAFVRSISVATPTSLLRAASRAFGVSEPAATPRPTSEARMPRLGGAPSSGTRGCWRRRNQLRTEQTLPATRGARAEWQASRMVNGSSAARCPGRRYAGVCRRFSSCCRRPERACSGTPPRHSLLRMRISGEQHVLHAQHATRSACPKPLE